jgi:RNA polymerase sigma factor (sigma-70 family)
LQYGELFWRQNTTVRYRYFAQRKKLLEIAAAACSRLSKWMSRISSTGIPPLSGTIDASFREFGMLKKILTEQGKQLLVDLRRYPLDGPIIGRIAAVLKEKGLPAEILSPQFKEKVGGLFHGRDISEIRTFLDSERLIGKGLFTRVAGTTTSFVASAADDDFSRVGLLRVIKAYSFDYDNPAPRVRIAAEFCRKIVDIDGVRKANWDHIEDWLRLLGRSHRCFELSDDRTFEDYLDVAKERVQYALPAFRGENAQKVPCTLPTWLYRVAKNALLYVLKRQRRRSAAEDAYVAEEQHDKELARISRTNSDAVIVDRDSIMTTIHSLGLDDDDLEIMVRVFDGERSKDIAAELAMPEGTVRSKKTRILDKLAKALRGEGLGCAKTGRGGL